MWPGRNRRRGSWPETMPDRFAHLRPPELGLVTPFLMGSDGQRLQVGGGPERSPRYATTATRLPSYMRVGCVRGVLKETLNPAAQQGGAMEDGEVLGQINELV